MERYIGYGYLVAALIGYLVTMQRSKQKAQQAAASSVKSFLGVAPTFLAVFGLVGLLEVFVPPALIERTLGAEGGLLSLFLGGAVGSVAAGPPVAAYPIAASLLSGGAWMPAVAAFIVSWTLVGFVSLPFEAKTFGWRFALVRNGFSFVFALVIGILMGAIV
ncbi:MAG: permease [Coriobacteriia bacterium]|nr:permease [Coriobacteriia bacterium]